MSIFTTLKNNLANFFTLGNLASGFFGIVAAMQGNEDRALVAIFICLILDFFDGFVARLTNSTSSIGKDLDSLADAVSFGVLPGIMIFNLLPENFAWVAVLVPVFSVWRLAKFNHDTRSSAYFYGLPTPANALCIAGFYWDKVFDGSTITKQFENFEWLVIIYVIISSLLLISNVKMLSNKISNFSLKKYFPHILVLIVAIFSIYYYLVFGLSLAIISYVLISIIITFVPSKTSSS